MLMLLTHFLTCIILFFRPRHLVACVHWRIARIPKECKLTIHQIDKNSKSLINSKTVSLNLPKVANTHIMKATTKVRLIRERAQDYRPQLYGA